MYIQLEKMKQKEEFERRKRTAEKKLREWMQKKREEVNYTSAASILAHAVLK